MRVSLIGNICNNHYVIAKGLRRAGVDAHLFYPQNTDVQLQPESDDPGLPGDGMQWLHPFRAQDLDYFPNVRPPSALMPFLKSSDLLHVNCDYGLFWALSSGRPYVWDPCGSDVYQTPFFSYWARAAGADPYTLLVPHMMRRAIEQASSIINHWWFDCWRPGLELIKILGARERCARIPLIPLDGTIFKPGPRVWRDDFLAKHGRKPTTLLLFHPTRHLFTEGNVEGYANDRIYRALAEARRRGADILLVPVRKGNPDEKEADKLISSLGLENDVVWVPGMRRHELISWYQNADITIAAVNGGSIGSVGVEALACGSPLMANFRLESDDPLFWSPPIVPPHLNVGTEQEICAAFMDAWRNREAIHQMGRDGREWFLQHMELEVVIKQYLALYGEILARPPKPFDRPLNPAPDLSALAEIIDTPPYEAALTKRERALWDAARFYAASSLEHRARLLEERAYYERQENRPGYLVKQLARIFLKRRHPPAG